MHFELYEGYVQQTNNLTEKIAGFFKEGQVDWDKVLDYSELKRRLGFEYNGMVLHEYYFGNLKAGQNEPQNGIFFKAIEKVFGSYEKWKKDFEQAGKTRGIGWAILYIDETTNNLTNHFIQEHENGHIAGFQPILVLDVWEHAYMVDHQSDGRGKYITAFMKNIDWKRVEERFLNVIAGKLNKRF